MKEIDFIPQWYKTGQKKTMSYHRQYALVMCLFVALLVWSFVSGGLVSRARAQVKSQQQLLEMSEPLADEYQTAKAEISALEEKIEILERIRPKANISNVLAELSHMVGDRIVLSKLSIETESNRQESSTNRKDTVRLSTSRSGKVDALPARDSVIRVVITGIAAEASDVAKLISRLEESPYFFRIVPGYSRNKEVRQFQVSEFEVSCYIANYVHGGRDKR